MKLKFFVNFLVAVLVIAGAGGTYFFYTKYQKSQLALNNPEIVAKTEAKIVADKVGKLIELPTDEDPQLLIITQEDLEKFKDQPFIANVKIGDKTLVFAKRKVAIIYREADNRIINVVTLVTAAPETSATPSATPVASVKPTVKPEASTAPLSE